MVGLSLHQSLTCHTREMTWKALELLALLTLLTCNKYADNKFIRHNKPRGPDKKPRGLDNKLIGMDNEPKELDNKVIRLDKKLSGRLVTNVDRKVLEGE